jgi:hypothetical protein
MPPESDRRPRVASTKTSTAKDFRRHKDGEDLTLPSGLRCKARRVGMQVLLREGVIPNSLMPMVQQALKTGQRGQDWDPAKILGDLTNERIQEYTKAMDAVVCAVVVEPKIHPVPLWCQRCRGDFAKHQADHTPEACAWLPEPMDDAGREREFGADAAFIDWIDEFDKTFLVAYATGGTADAEKFRREYSQFVGGLQPGEDVASPA